MIGQSYVNFIIYFVELDKVCIYEFFKLLPCHETSKIPFYVFIFFLTIIFNNAFFFFNFTVQFYKSIQQVLVIFHPPLIISYIYLNLSVITKFITPLIYLGVCHCSQYDGMTRRILLGYFNSADWGSTTC